MKLRKYRSIGIVLVALLAPLTGAKASDTASQKVFEHQLENGLQILVKPDQRAPVVVSQIWYRIGSSFEMTGITGVSHVLEHMMFKGTDRFGPGQMSDLVAKYGGSENAFTSRDYTGYYQQWEKSRLPLSFAIEANRMTELKMDPDQFAKEVKVVMEERRQRTDDSPLGTAYERFYAAAFVSSPYQNPVIGWMHDIEQLTLEVTKHWYDKWYAPNNAILVVAGDVDPHEVFELAQLHFGDIAAKQVPKLPLYNEVEPKGEKRLTIKENVKVPQLMFGFLTPTLGTAKDLSTVYALSMLVGVLDGGLSARFETNLVRGQTLAASIGSSYSPLSRGDSLLTIAAIPNKDVDLDTLEEAVFEQLEALKKYPPSQQELDRALAQIKASEIFGQDSLYQQADFLGRFAVIDQDWRIGRDWLKSMSKVTPQDVQNAAKTYLIRDRMTLVSVVPKDAALEDSQ